MPYLACRHTALVPDVIAMVTSYRDLRGYTSLLEGLGVKGRVAAYYLSRCLSETILLFIFLSVDKILKKNSWMYHGHPFLIS